MPSFDLISQLDMGELKNALNMAKKQITGRYDFKGSNISLELQKNDSELEIIAEDDYKMKAALDIFYTAMGKRNLGLKGLEVGTVEPTGHQMFKQVIGTIFFPPSKYETCSGISCTCGSIFIVILDHLYYITISMLSLELEVCYHLHHSS